MKEYQILKEKIASLVIFSLIGFAAMQMPINSLMGANVKFTMFDLFAPVFGSFLGLWFGFAAVILAQIINAFATQVTINTAVLVRTITPLFAIWYFSRKDKSLLLVPFLAILSFNFNPVGRSVWYFSLYWLIPVIAWRFRDRFLFAKALGSIFSAHAVGGAIWIWAFNLPASVWQGLIPVVALERSIMALGVCASYILMSNVLAYTKNKNILKQTVIDKKYLLRFIR
ncbi:MAG: hypothetical protein UU23_C0001G0138 [Candidatus Curtissbacteria bacterium GW2011_GWA1_40_9]|uniref:ECF transporter S component n=1 Tax=Candidatus Curtissbacteria bacterium GW2011_GWA1_40_9 TaxID=1618408 RepID=A0A0G0TMV4_9BACT|nr:MAG: hypothetical protein UU23_C0001G0138 [Candidatus Curtissbacteria bacterium GW2011_GWA1_40_9]